ncbi:hypothetical protein [Streptomyces endophyticus]|uniref:Lipoprotein n=1 Tax=Streptomyces endophyticus TaxID=714166 RepID=A0ABU6FBF9_9ACTN|nr:hypothetical protein [Streptomyces endophyticus]MEB8341309.1 hypothetical protein [Streptomyces endophyticus]
MRQLSVSQRALSLNVLRLGRLAATTVAVAAAAGCMSVGADGGAAPTHSPPQRGSGAAPDGGAEVPDGGTDVGARVGKASAMPSRRPASPKVPATPSSASPTPTKASTPTSAPTSPSRSATQRPSQRPSSPSATSTPSPTKSSAAPSSSPPTAEPSSSAHEETAGERASEPRPQAGDPA